MEKREGLSDFAAAARGLDMRNKLKLILFASGVKPNAFVVLRANAQTLHEEHQFDALLKEYGIKHIKNRPKSYEEISRIKGNRIIWELAGVWVGYDLFDSQDGVNQFKKYVDHLMSFDHARADKVAGRLYGYPVCDITQHIKERNRAYLGKYYSYYDYYKKHHDLDRKFPFVFHRAHDVGCKETEKLNKLYEKTVKETKASVWTRTSERKTYRVDMIITGLSDVMADSRSIWPDKDGFEYELVTAKPVEKKYWLLPFLTKQKYGIGTVLDVELSFRYHYADVRVKGVRKKSIKDIFHQRKLPLLGRVF